MKSFGLLKPIITDYRPNDTRKLCSFIIPNNKAGELNVAVRKEGEDYGHRFVIELKNRFNKILGFEDISIFNGSDRISGLYIQVEKEYQRKGYRLGEILRLASIIEMLESKAKRIDITSKDSAIYFHSKYKFKPDEHYFEGRNNLLKTIVNDSSVDFQDIAKKGKELQETIAQTSDSSIQRELCNDANNIFEEYINRAIETDSIKDHRFDRTMNMTLEKKTIFENRDFFNNLFKKHGIDYTV